MSNSLTRPNFARTLLERIRARPDTEFQQALIRLIIVVGLFLYFSLGNLGHSTAIASQTFFIGLGLTLISLSLLVSTLIGPTASVARRSIGMLHDFTVVTYMLAISNETGAPLVTVYLWVILENGFRYGLPYLYVSTLASALGFVTVYLFNPFWHAHTPLWWSIWLILLIVPLYVSSLLRQLHGAIKREKEARLAKSNFLARISHELRTPPNGSSELGTAIAKQQTEPPDRHGGSPMRTIVSHDMPDNVVSLFTHVQPQAGQAPHLRILAPEDSQINQRVHAAHAHRTAGTASERDADELDESVLDALATMGGHAFVQDVLASFEEDSTRAIRDIERAFQAQDYKQWQDQLRMLKGGARDIGAHLLAQRCAEAEQVKSDAFANGLAREPFETVRSALLEAQTALEVYQANKLRTEHP